MSVSLGSAAGDREIALGGGRVMLVREYGDPGGEPVIALHGTPASRLMYSAAKTASSHGLRLIAPDRWGYGGTSPPAAVRLAAFSDDMAILAEQLGLDRFAVLGVSGGGPYAAATAALLPHRVTALALVAPVGPIIGIDGGVELSAFHRFCFRLLPSVPGPLRLIFWVFRRALAVSPEGAIRIAMWRSPSRDHDVMADREARARFAAMFKEGLRPGVGGGLIDMRVFSQPWDVPLAAITAPSALWVGSDDNNVPVAAARALAAAIPCCQLIELDDEGHLWIVRNYDGVLDWLADKGKGHPAQRMRSRQTDDAQRVRPERASPSETDGP